MVVALVIRNILLRLFVISNFILIGNKGLAHAKICLKSAETVQVVQNCPKNQREWEEAAQRKKCSETQKYDNCTNVEYHCLVNEFRNETIEVCTSPKYLLGYCPLYSLNAAKNDYTKKCVEYLYPCNCSSYYISTEAYKWQCCFNGTNGNSREIQIETNSDKKSNGLLVLWICIGILVGLVFLGCVIYGNKCQNKPLFEALQIWRNISCKSPICACSSSDSKEDGLDKGKVLKEATTKDTILNGSEETNPLLERHEDNLNSVTNEVLTSDEYNSKSETSADSAAIEGSSNSAKSASHLTPVTKNSNSLTSEGNGPKPEATASQTVASSNVEPFEDDSKPDAISSQGVNLNSEASVLPISNATPDSNENLVTAEGGNISEKPASQTPETNNSNSRTSEVDGPKPEEIVSQLHDEANSNSGASSLLTPDLNGKSVTANNAPVMQPSEIDLRAIGLCHNLITKYDDPLNAENTMMTPMKEPTLDERKECVKKLKNELEGKMLYYFGGDLEYKLKSTKQKIIRRNSCGNLLMCKLKMDNIKDKFKSLEEKAKTLEEILQKMNEVADDNIKVWTNTGSEGPVASCIDHLPPQDDNTQRMEGHIRMPERHPAILPKQSKKIWSDGKGPGENMLVSEKIDKLKRSFESWWAAISLKLPAFRRLEEDLLDIEVDTVIINYLFGFDISELNVQIETGHQKAFNKDDMQVAIEELQVTFDELKENNESF